MQDNVQRLTELLRILGADKPEEWASSQVFEDIPQVARFLFLRQAWRLVVSPSDPSWIESQVKAPDEFPTGQNTDVSRALRSLQAKGATPDEITTLVRGMQAELLFSLCYLLDDPGDIEVSDINWGLFLLDSNSKPVSPISGLYESVLGTDPMGKG